MLTEDEIKYLNKILPDKKVVIKPYDPEVPKIVDELIKKIKSVEPNLEVVHIGATALKISGQGDIDLSVLCPRESFPQHIENLKKVFGEKIAVISLVLWRTEKNGHEIEICLADPKEPSTARQLKIFKILSQNLDLLKEYELLKESASKESYCEYQRLKYEFYNKIL